MTSLPANIIIRVNKNIIWQVKYCSSRNETLLNIKKLTICIFRLFLWFLFKFILKFKFKLKLTFKLWHQCSTCAVSASINMDFLLSWSYFIHTQHACTSPVVQTGTYIHFIITAPRVHSVPDFLILKYCLATYTDKSNIIEVMTSSFEACP